MLRRKLNIGGEVWKYQVGSRYIKIKQPDGKCHYINKDKITFGRLEEGLTPSLVKRYAEVVLIKGDRWLPRRHQSLQQAD